MGESDTDTSVGCVFLTMIIVAHTCVSIYDNHSSLECLLISEKRDQCVEDDWHRGESCENYAKHETTVCERIEVEVRCSRFSTHCVFHTIAVYFMSAQHASFATSASLDLYLL